MNNPAAQTALGPMIIVAADQHESAPLVHDPGRTVCFPRVDGSALRSPDGQPYGGR